MPYRTLDLDIPPQPADARQIATEAAEQTVERNNKLLVLYAALATLVAIGAAIGLSAL